MKKLLLLLLLSLGFVGLCYSNTYYVYDPLNNGVDPLNNGLNFDPLNNGYDPDPLNNGVDTLNNGEYKIITYSGRRFLDFGTTWKKVGNSLRGSNGVVCPNFSSSRASCTNGVSYWMCGNRICGSDGTYYWNEGSSCQRSSFGSYCCNDGYGTHSATCR